MSQVKQPRFKTISKGLSNTILGNEFQTGGAKATCKMDNGNDGMSEKRFSSELSWKVGPTEECKMTIGFRTQSLR